MTRCRVNCMMVSSVLRSSASCAFPGTAGPAVIVVANRAPQMLDACFCRNARAMNVPQPATRDWLRREEASVGGHCNVAREGWKWLESGVHSIPESAVSYTHLRAHETPE